MKITCLFLLSCCLLGSVSADEVMPEKQAFQQHAKLAIKDFATQLKAALFAEMQQGGPASAINVCRTIAPNLAEKLSDKYQLNIGRTSLKVRNPNNVADKWETSVLTDFEERFAQGEEIKNITFLEQVDGNWHLMKAIPTGQVCLNCHGNEIAPAVKQQLAELYPDDQAVGFKLGDIRGAFTISEKAP